MKPGVATVSQTIRILLIDGQAMVREGLKLLIERQQGLAVIAEASTCEDAVAAVRQAQPDVVLFDLDIDAGKVADCFSEMIDAAPHARVIVLAGASDQEAQYEAVSKGAMGLVNKLEAPETLLEAIKKVYAGEVWLDGLLIARLLEDFWRVRNEQQSGKRTNGSQLDWSENGVVQSSNARTQQPPPDEVAKISQLTAREREVICLIGEGLRNKQIADRLFISDITVRHHLSSIFSKLDVEDRFELAIYSYRFGLAPAPF